MVPGSFLLPAGLFITGWTARADVHWIAPDIGIALVGAGTILNFQCIQTYVIDTFTLHAASGTSRDSASPLRLPACCVSRLTRVCSARRGDVPALARGLRLPALRARDVQRAGVRQRRHDPRVLRDRRRHPFVRPPLSTRAPLLTLFPVPGRSCSGRTARASAQPASTPSAHNSPFPPPNLRCFVPATASFAT